MQDYIFYSFWSQLHLLGKILVVSLSLAICSLRSFFFYFSEDFEKYFRSTALGIELALVFWPVFPSCIIRGRVDLATWFIFPLLFGLGNLAHFLFLSFFKKNFPLRDFSSAAVLALFFVPWLPVSGNYLQSAQLIWAALVFSFFFSSDRGNYKIYFLGLLFLPFFISFFGLSLPSQIPFWLAFLIGVWTYGLFLEMLVLFSFFPEGKKRYFPALLAFVFTLSASLYYA